MRCNVLQPQSTRPAISVPVRPSERNEILPQIRRLLDANNVLRWQRGFPGASYDSSVHPGAFLRNGSDLQRQRRLDREFEFAFFLHRVVRDDEGKRIG